MNIYIYRIWIYIYIYGERGNAVLFIFEDSSHSSVLLIFRNFVFKYLFACLFFLSGILLVKCWTTLFYLFLKLPCKFSVFLFVLLLSGNFLKFILQITNIASHLFNLLFNPTFIFLTSLIKFFLSTCSNFINLKSYGILYSWKLFFNVLNHFRHP